MGDWFYDSPPPPNKRFSLTNVSRLLDTRNDVINKNVSIILLVLQRVIER